MKLTTHSPVFGRGKHSGVAARDFSLRERMEKAQPLLGTGIVLTVAVLVVFDITV